MGDTRRDDEYIRPSVNAYLKKFKILAHFFQLISESSETERCILANLLNNIRIRQ